MTDPVRYRAVKKRAGLHDPRRDFALTEIEAEVRYDPLTGDSARICHFGTSPREIPDLAPLVASSFWMDVLNRILIAVIAATGSRFVEAPLVEDAPEPFPPQPAMHAMTAAGHVVAHLAAARETGDRVAILQPIFTPYLEITALERFRFEVVPLNGEHPAASPADAELGKLAQRPDIVALSFHVDYWDRLGWKDRFADPGYSARQAAQAGRSRRRPVPSSPGPIAPQSARNHPAGQNVGSSRLRDSESMSHSAAGRLQGDQAGHGHQGGDRPLRGRAAGPRPDGSPEHRPGPRRRQHADRPAATTNETVRVVSRTSSTCVAKSTAARATLIRADSWMPTMLSATRIVITTAPPMMSHGRIRSWLRSRKTYHSGSTPVAAQAAVERPAG